jgi:hypothetical protein
VSGRNITVYGLLCLELPAHQSLSAQRQFYGRAKSVHTSPPFSAQFLTFCNINPSLKVPLFLFSFRNANECANETLKISNSYLLPFNI